MSKERLDKIVSYVSSCSRKDAKELIRKGRIRVCGNIIRDPEFKCDPVSDNICINDKPISYSHFTYLMLNKPAGVLSATTDSHDRTVLDLLPGEYRRKSLFPVGRLDKDTVGLLLLTDNGDLAHRLLAPRRHVDKTYYAIVRGIITADDVQSFKEGIRLGDEQLCMPAELLPDPYSGTDLQEGTSDALVTIHEGKFHQIKRMFLSCGKEVIYLKRLQMGPISLDPSLAEGEFRPLNEAELNELKPYLL